MSNNGSNQAPLTTLREISAKAGFSDEIEECLQGARKLDGDEMTLLSLEAGMSRQDLGFLIGDAKVQLHESPDESPGARF